MQARSTLARLQEKGSGLSTSPLARTLKWLALVLFAYVITAMVVGPDWSVVLRNTFVPSLPGGREAWGTLVAILGTTISPYLFFWQASEEVEEEKASGESRLADRKGATRQELSRRWLDVGIGTLFSNIVMFFIILTTALTLHRHGITNPQTSREVAEERVGVSASRSSARLMAIWAAVAFQLVGSHARPVSGDPRPAHGPGEEGVVAPHMVPSWSLFGSWLREVARLRTVP